MSERGDISQSNNSLGPRTHHIMLSAVNNSYTQILYVCIDNEVLILQVQSPNRPSSWFEFAISSFERNTILTSFLFQIQYITTLGAYSISGFTVYNIIMIIQSKHEQRKRSERALRLVYIQDLSWVMKCNPQHRDIVIKNLTTQTLDPISNQSVFLINWYHQLLGNVSLSFVKYIHKENPGYLHYPNLESTCSRHSGAYISADYIN